jgi:glycerol-3-phosphate acyltransferase PlsX
MSKPVVVALDAMGGDNAPVQIIKGAVDAVNGSDKVIVKVDGIKE